MTRLRLLADDLTGALDCAAAFGAGVPVHLGTPQHAAPAGLDIVATATRDVAPGELPQLLQPCVPWLRGADFAFKKVDSLLRGNTFDEIDWLARAGGWPVLVLAPAFPAQGRVAQAGRQWVARAGSPPEAVADMAQALRERGWAVDGGPMPPVHRPGSRIAWVPDVADDATLDAIARAAAAARAQPWLWCGSAGLAAALARTLHLPPRPTPAPAQAGGQVLLASASHHAVSREQWRRLWQASPIGTCLHAHDPVLLERPAAGYPTRLDLCAEGWLGPADAAGLLQAQARAIAAHAPRPRDLVVVGGDTLLALCEALGTRALVSLAPLQRPGWGCAAMVGGAWDGLACHTRSGAFGGPDDLVEVLALLEARDAAAARP